MNGTDTMRVVISLYVLLMLDSAFSGICAASGRNALVQKKAYYLRSMWHGAWWGNAACISGIFVLLLTCLLAADRAKTCEEMVAVGSRMSQVYWVYAAIVLLTFLVRAIPSVDVRAMTSTVAFGPLTLARPAVVMMGIAWGLMIQPELNVMIAAVLIGLMMMPFRVFLDHRFGTMSEYARSP